MNAGNGFGSSAGLPLHNPNQENHPSPSGAPESGHSLSRDSNMTPQEDSNGESLNGSADDANFYNPSTFYQNQSQAIVNPVAQFSPSPFVPPHAFSPVPSRQTSINARAAELKQQLLKSREARARSSTPASHTGIPGLAAEPTAKSHPVGTVRQPSQLQQQLPQARTISHEDDISALISQLAPAPESAPAEASPRPGYNQVLRNPLPQRPQTDLELLPMELAESSAGDTQQAAQSPVNGEVAGNSALARFVQTSNSYGSPSELSDGEILEERVTESTNSAVQRATEEDSTVKAKIAESATPQFVHSDISGGNRQQNLSQNSLDRGPPESGRDYQQYFSSRQMPSQSEPPQRGMDRSETVAELPLDQRVQLSHRENALKEQIAFQYRLRTVNGGGAQDRRDVPLVRGQQRETTQPDSKQAVDALEQVLLHNPDLREWLVHTGYYNVPYRNKILNARREIAALDAKRERLFAELMAEERHGFLFTPAPSTLPISLSNKADTPNEHSLTLGSATPSAHQEQITSNKRPFSDFQEMHKVYSNISEKAPRFDDGGSARRTIEEGEPSRGRPISRGNDTGPRISPDYRAVDRDRDREPDRPHNYSDYRFHHHHEDPRMRAAREREQEWESSRERDFFFSGPPQPPPLSRSYDRESSLRDFEPDMLSSSASRAFEPRGSHHRPKGDDPGYRGGGGKGRARGRARGGDF